ACAASVCGGSAFWGRGSAACGKLEEWSELRGCLELRDWVEFLERARERIGETPWRPGSEFLDLWIEVQVVKSASEMFRDIQLALDECPVDDELRTYISKTRSLPSLDLFPHGLEVPLHAVHPDREYVYEAQVLGMFCEYWCERTRDNISTVGDLGH